MLNARREALFAGAGGLAVATVMKAPAVAALGRGVPKDLGDPLLGTWILAWGAHALRTRPFRPWDGNAFWPLHDCLAFSDSMYGYSPLGVLFGSGRTAALVRYSVLFLIAYGLAAAAAYLLARQLGCRALPAAVAAAAYAFAPWHLGQDGHLHVLSNGAVPLALALLARGHGIGTRAASMAARPWCVVGGWVVAAWQLTLGFAVGLQLAYLLGLVALGGAALAGLGRWRPIAGGRTLIVANVAGVALFAAIGALFAEPYFDVARLHPEATRTVGDLRLYSPPLRGFLISPAESTVWGDRHSPARAHLAIPGEMALNVGIVLALLALYGLVRGAWSRARRLGLGLATALVLLLAAGTTVAGGRLYLLLFEHGPGWRGVRTPGRLVVLATLGLALLAATGVEAMSRRSRWPRALGLALVCAVLVDGHGDLPAPRAPAPSAGLAAATEPVLVLPSDGLLDMQAMWASTAGFPRMVNGGSGFTPRLLNDVRRRTVSFPDSASVNYLRGLGVRSVVFRPALAPGTPWQGVEGRSVGNLGVTVRRVGDDLLYDLMPESPGGGAAPG